MILSHISRYLSEQPGGLPAVEEIVFNPNFTGVMLENKDMGMAMNIREGSRTDSGNALELAEALIGENGSSALTLAAQAEGHLAMSVRVALINALSVPLMNRAHLEQCGYSVAFGRENYSLKEMVAGKSVVIVGFGGNVTKIAGCAEHVVVTELEPERFFSRVVNKDGLANGPFCADVISADHASQAFEKASVVVLTGCTLVTRTMEDILQQCRGKEVYVYGVTASFFPDLMFELGVDAVATTIVRDSDGMMNALKNCGPMVERFFGSAGRELFIQRKK